MTDLKLYSYRTLRVVKPADRPLVALTMAEKRANAIAWLRDRNRYISDIGSIKPSRGPLVPMPNLANVQPTVAAYDCGLIGQWRNLVRWIWQ